MPKRSFPFENLNWRQIGTDSGLIGQGLISFEEIDEQDFLKSGISLQKEENPEENKKLNKRTKHKKHTPSVSTVKEEKEEINTGAE